MLATLLFASPFCSVFIFAVLAYFVFWLVARMVLGGGAYNMDPHGVPGAFEPHLARYQSIAKLIVTLSAATVAFLFNFLVSRASGTSANGYGNALEKACPVAILLLCLSAFCGLVFVLGQTYIYESYCHSRTKDTYTGALYAAQVAFGFSGLTWFIVSYGYIAYKLFARGPG
jgi:heme/copper-type cytochrome/quinol oxidase subunit 3